MGRSFVLRKTFLGLYIKTDLEPSPEKPEVDGDFIQLVRCNLKSKPPEALSSQIDLKGQYLQPSRVVELVPPLQMGCVLTFFYLSSYSEDFLLKEGHN